MSSSMSKIVSEKCPECPVLSGKVSKMSDQGSGRGAFACCMEPRDVHSLGLGRLARKRSAIVGRVGMRLREIMP